MGPPRPSQSGLIPYSTDSPQDIHPATSPRLLAVQLHPHTPFTECSTAPSWEPSQASNSINYQQVKFYMNSNVVQPLPSRDNTKIL